MKSYLINSLDIYSSEYKLRFKGEKEYNSLFGKIIGGISIFIFISLFVNFSIELFPRRNFDILYSSSINNDFIINLTNVPFFFSFVDNNSNFLPFNDNIFNISIQYKKEIHYNLTQPEYHSFSFNLETCDKSFIPSEYLDDFNEIPNEYFSNFKCFPRNLELLLQGRMGINSSSILIIISKCNETSICEKIDYSSMKSASLIMSYLSYSLDHYSYDKPIKRNSRAEFFPISFNNIRKSFTYYFQGGKYESNNGLLFNFIHNYEFFELQQRTLDFEIYENNNYNILTTIEFCTSEKYNIYNRNYKTIQYYLGLFQGCCQAIYSIINIVTNYILTKMSSRDIVNEIFFHNLKNEKKSKFQNIPKLQKNIMNQKSSFSDNKRILKKNLSSLEQINERNKKNSIFTYDILNTSLYQYYFKSIKFNFCDYFIPFILYKQNKEIQIFLSLKKNIDKKISIEELYFNKICKDKQFVLNQVCSNEINKYL